MCILASRHGGVIQTLPDNDLNARLATLTPAMLASAMTAGLLRVYLSVNVEVAASLQTLNARESLSAILHSFAITAFLALFALVPIKIPVGSARKKLVALVCAVATMVYSLGCIPDLPAVLSLACTLLTDLYIAFIFRLWGEDCTPRRIEGIVAVVGLSFLVQYIVYSCLIVLPVEMRTILTALLPVLMGFSLVGESAETAHTTPPESHDKKGVGTLAIALTAMTIFLCCAAHALLFCLPGDNTTIWTLGPLVMFLLATVCRHFFRHTPLFKVLVCITLLLQFAMVIPSIASGFGPAFTSFSRTLSYSATMFLTMVIGCRYGLLGDKGAGKAVCGWLALYMAAFYSVTHLAQAWPLEPLLLCVIVMSCLLVAMVLVVVGEWADPGIERDAFVASRQEPPSKEMPSESQHDIASACAALASQHELTQRETEVLQLIVSGLSAGETAQRLFVSQNTVRAQIQSVYRKLGTHSRQELARLVAQHESEE